MLAGSAALPWKSLNVSTERWPKLSVMSSAARVAPPSAGLKPTRTLWICVSRAFGVALTHCRPPWSGSPSSWKSFSSAFRSDAAATMAAGVEPSTCSCLRAVTCLRSTSYSHSVWPSATMVCSNGFW